jgi:hypothetical protein
MADLYQRFEDYDEIKPLLQGSDEEVLVALRGKPALIRIPGTDARPRARLVACLLHGNEDSGYRAVLDMLREGAYYPYDLWVLIGNVRAASTGGWFAHRYLDDQEDFNRVWGLGPPTTRMRRCAAEIVEVLEREADLEAAVDVHNNTGDNPFYAILPQWSPEGLHLAATCSDLLLLWNLRNNTLMEALSDRCPSIALEAGMAGVAEHTAFAREALDRVLAADFDGGLRAPERVYEIRARVIVRPEVAFAFGGALGDDLDLVLRPGLDSANFGVLLAGTEIGQVATGAAMPLCAMDMHGIDVTDRVFAVRDNGRLVVTTDTTPVMMVTTVRQTRQDCLFYVARRRR